MILTLENYEKQHISENDGTFKYVFEFLYIEKMLRITATINNNFIYISKYIDVYEIPTMQYKQDVHFDQELDNETFHFIEKAIKVQIKKFNITN